MSPATLAPAPATGLAAPAPRKFTRDEYDRLVELGFFDGERVQLFQGEILEMPGHGNWHAMVVAVLTRTLTKGCPDGLSVRCQLPLNIGPDSEPEPDISVVTGELEQYVQHPTTAVLVVEVSDTSLALDRRKANAYASVGVAEYWIVNLQDLRVEVYREPVPNPAARFGHEYRAVTELAPSQSVSPMGLPQLTIPVASLIPAPLLAVRRGTE